MLLVDRLSLHGRIEAGKVPGGDSRPCARYHNGGVAITDQPSRARGAEASAAVAPARRWSLLGVVALVAFCLAFLSLAAVVFSSIQIVRELKEQRWPTAPGRVISSRVWRDSRPRRGFLSG